MKYCRLFLDISPTFYETIDSCQLYNLCGVELFVILLINNFEMNITLVNKVEYRYYKSHFILFYL